MCDADERVVNGPCRAAVDLPLPYRRYTHTATPVASSSLGYHGICAVQASLPHPSAGGQPQLAP